MINKKDLPKNFDAEVAVLGAMLIKNGESITKIQSILTAEDFFVPEHRIIFQAIMDLYERQNQVDEISLSEYLQKNNQLDIVGGPVFIMTIGDSVPTDANIVHHANIIKEKSILRKLIDAGEYIISESYDDSKEVKEIMDDAEKKIFSITSNENSGDFEHIQPIITRVFNKINYLYEHNGGHTGVPTNFKDLDEATGGLQNSDLILLAARPSMGKTAFALNIASNISMGYGSNPPKPVAIFSLEMSKEQLAQRILSSRSGVEARLLKTGSLKRDEWKTVSAETDEISKAKLYIDDTAGLTVMELRSRARHLKSVYGLDLLIIDYLQLMQGRNSKGGEVNRQQEISEISRSLKALARELNVPIIALSQLSRAVEMRAEKRPLLSDLRESGSLEQDADIVMFLYREDYYKQTESNANLTELIIAKHRNGPTKTIKLHFNKQLIRFGCIAQDRNDEEVSEG